MLGSWPEHSIGLEQIKNKISLSQLMVGSGAANPQLQEERTGCLDCDKVITVLRFSEIEATGLVDAERHYSN
jgi:hypothetical protein